MSLIPVNDNGALKITILMGSPRHKGNTAELLKPFMIALHELNQFQEISAQYITLSDKNIAPCKGCYACQQVPGIYGCAQEDDMWQLTGQLLWSDIIVLATPIYTWSCPAETKAFLDRLYGLNKYYGAGAPEGAGPTATGTAKETGAMLSGKGLALITTHGYDQEYGAGPFEAGIRRYCEHSHLDYYGMYSVRDTDDLASFQTEEAVAGAKRFAQQIVLEWMNRHE